MLYHLGEETSPVWVGIMAELEVGVAEELAADVPMMLALAPAERAIRMVAYCIFGTTERVGE